jgi:glycosyltransferase involved in cell wall biosynthesis
VSTERANATLHFVSFSLDAWSPVWLNRHHVMSRLAERHPVLFVSQRARPRDILANTFLHHLPTPGLRRLGPNLLELVPSRLTPRIDLPPLDAPFRALHLAQVRDAARLLGRGPRVLYLWHPAFEPLAGKLGESLVVFHCYDDYFGYTHVGKIQRRRLWRAQQRLARRADLVFAAGNAMRETLPEDVPVHIIANGVDFDSHERTRAEGSPVPPEFQAIQRPILAHIGRINAKVDFPLLRAIARRRRDWAIVLVGPHEGLLTPKDLPEYEAMAGEPNVHRVGFVPPDRLARYIQAMDVGLMAYRLRGWVTKVSPLKLFEYLAGGKPIVAPELEELRRYPQWVTFARTPDEWIAAIEHSLKNDSAELAQQRIALARQNSWDARCERILELIHSKLDARGTRGRP